MNQRWQETMYRAMDITVFGLEVVILLKILQLINGVMEGFKL